MTKTVGIIGHPVRHSLSPLLHNRWFQDLGLDFLYERWNVAPSALKKAIRVFDRRGVVGFNVTVPHKERVLKYLDGLSPEVRAIGAVNTVVRKGDRFLGENTDGYGFLESCREAGAHPAGKSILILGAGGAARALGFALAKAHAKRVTVAARRLPQAQGLALSLRRRFPKVSASACALTRGRIALEETEFDWIVNATPVGLHARDPIPLTPDLFQKGQFVCDLIYHRRTKFLSQAEERGARTLGGLGMLLHQAARSFHLWTGQWPSLPLGAKILKEEMGGKHR